jgi:hypothetical protein
MGPVPAVRVLAEIGGAGRFPWRVADFENEQWPNIIVPLVYCPDVSRET